MPPLLRITLLGGFSAGAGDRVVSEGAWRLRKAKSLVKLLALAPERRLHRERASELLWPDRDPAAATSRSGHNSSLARSLCRRRSGASASSFTRLFALRSLQAPSLTTWSPAPAEKPPSSEIRTGGDMLSPEPNPALRAGATA